LTHHHHQITAGRPIDQFSIKTIDQPAVPFFLLPDPALFFPFSLLPSASILVALAAPSAFRTCHSQRDQVRAAQVSSLSLRPEFQLSDTAGFPLIRHSIGPSAGPRSHATATLQSHRRSHLLSESEGCNQFSRRRLGPNDVNTSLASPCQAHLLNGAFKNALLLATAILLCQCFTFLAD
jgi:hypothetical protein